MKGRKPKPTQLKVLEGNPGQRPLNESEPKPKPVVPEPPEWLDEVALEEWNRLAPLLESINLLTETDYIAFGNLMQEYSDMIKYRVFIRDNGPTYEHVNVKGEKNITTRPEAILLQKCVQNIKALCVEFGLTPSARSRIQIPGMEDRDDGMERLLEKR